MDEGDPEFTVYKNEKNKLVFEDNANVQITGNYVRGITNYGVAEIGAGTVICDNGTWDSGESYESCRVAMGGGVYNANVMTVHDGAQLYNNHANTAGDDIYNENEAQLTFAGVGRSWKLDGEPDCDHAITGWFRDGESARWEAHDQPYQVEKYGETTTVGLLALKAAHGLYGSYQVVHQYYLDADLEGSWAETLDAEVGSIITPDGVVKQTDYDGHSYEYVSCTPETITVEQGSVPVLTLKYTRTEGGGSNPGGGGGGGRDDSDPTPPAPTPTPDPDPEPELPDEDVPLSDLPVDETPETPDASQGTEEQTEQAEIPDEKVPLADVPQTGDASGLWALMGLASAGGLMGLLGKRKQEN